MGYTTEFDGCFEVDRVVDEETCKLLRGLTTTRRMMRSGLGEEYGLDGEFYWEDDGECGQSHSPKLGKIEDFNKPPRTQPSLWCQWELASDNKTIRWDGGEKFYSYVEWIQYLISSILAPKCYKVNGMIRWRGEEFDDMGTIMIVNNKISIGGM